MNHHGGDTCTHAQRPARRTAPCDRFFEAHAEHYEFFVFILEMAMKLDRSVKRAAEALLHLGGTTGDKLAEKAKNGAGANRTVQRFFPLLNQILLARQVESFLAYLSELLALAYLTRPEMLRTDEKIAYKEILDFSSMDDLVSNLAERKIHRLSYSSLEDLVHTLDQQHGIVLFEKPEDLRRGSILVAQRNLIAHNRGVVNRLFKKLVPECPLEIGVLLELEFDDVNDGIDFLAHAVVRIDTAAISKFQLPCLGA
ncbi:MAG: hypothetical protein NT105_03600 [Verrucomicrobia bacterium]|nr:hypothetical protein [Verrucomicrobiota bacterium]